MTHKGKARLDRRTKNLVKRLGRKDIAIIDHEDIDEVAAKALIEVHPQLIINTSDSITGRYPTRGAYKILKAGIPIVDGVGGEIFDKIRENSIIEVTEGSILMDGNLVAKGEPLALEEVQMRLKKARENMKQELDSFVENTLEYARREKDILLDDIELPPMRTTIENRHCLIVVRGKNYKEDLRAIKGYMEEQKPVLIGVDGGADALLEFGFTPDIIVGDMDSVSDQALNCGAEIIVHAYTNGNAPGLSRVQSMSIPCQVVPMPGTSEDVAMIIAYEKEASLVVAVGAHSNILDFLEKGRKGMGSTFLVRLKMGSILVDAKGVNQLYRQSLKARHLFQLLLASLVPILIILLVAPSTRPFIKLVVLQVKLFLGI